MQVSVASDLAQFQSSGASAAAMGCSWWRSVLTHHLSSRLFKASLSVSLSLSLFFFSFSFSLSLFFSLSLSLSLSSFSLSLSLSLSSFVTDDKVQCAYAK